MIIDGSSDNPIPALGGKTPFEYLDLPGCDVVAGGMIGLARTVPIGAAPGSDTAILTIFGNDISGYSGRAALEAAGAGVLLREDEAALRVNLCSIGAGDDFRDSVMLSHNGFGIEGGDARELADALNGITDAPVSVKVHPSATFRHIGVVSASDLPDMKNMPPLKEPHNILGEVIGAYLPGSGASGLAEWMERAHRVLSAHPINARRGAKAANCAWPWAYGTGMSLPSFADKYRHHGPVITAVPLLKGIARLSGLPAPDIAGATGDIDTDYEAKVGAALSALRGGADFAAVHVEAPDECSHAKDLEGKLEAIRRADSRVVVPLLNGMEEMGKMEGMEDFGGFRMLVMPDHPTFLENGAHDGSPVPFALYDSRKKGTPRKFCEAAARLGVFVADGKTLMDLLFEY